MTRDRTPNPEHRSDLAYPKPIADVLSQLIAKRGYARHDPPPPWNRPGAKR